MKTGQLLIFVLISISLFSCNEKRKKLCEGNLSLSYEFDFPVTITPGTDTIPMGDTLWVEIRIDNPALNKLNSKSYDLSKADFKLFFSISDLLLPTALDNHKYIPLDEYGNYLPNSNPDGDNTNKVVFVKDSSGHLYWKRGFVITQRGLYMLQFTNILNGKGQQPHITECPRENVTLKHSFNGDTTAVSKNYHFLQYSHDPNVRSWSSWQYEQGDVYTICVD